MGVSLRKIAFAIMCFIYARSFTEGKVRKRSFLASFPQESFCGSVRRRCKISFYSRLSVRKLQGFISLTAKKMVKGKETIQVKMKLPIHQLIYKRS